MAGASASLLPVVAPLTSLRPDPVEPLSARLAALVADLRDELVAVRRDIHAHPELGRTEDRTYQLVADRLRAAGLEPRPLPGSGVVCDLGPSPTATGRNGSACGRTSTRCRVQRHVRGAVVLDGLWRDPRVRARRAHRGGAGAGLALAAGRGAGELTTGVRLIFQPAEEVQPGARSTWSPRAAWTASARSTPSTATPRSTSARSARASAPITSASDEVTVTVSGPGGHTSRPHLTGDVVFALGQVITQVPAILGRRLDPRSGVNLTWGAVQAGAAHNAIPATGVVKGTLRCLDVRAWEKASEVFHAAVEQVVAPLGVTVDVRHHRGVPPVENDEHATGVLEAAARDVLGPGSVLLTEQSLGGEDFAWYLTKVPGAMARLGTRTPGGHTFDIHQGDLRVDERAVEVGALFLARAGGSRRAETARPSPGPTYQVGNGTCSDTPR